VPIEPWWETNPATTPRQELGMVSPELPYGVPGTPLGSKNVPFAGFRECSTSSGVGQRSG